MKKELGRKQGGTGAAADSIAGIIYGYDLILKEWVDNFMRKD